MWERGDKTNQGITEINASSIGMAKVHTRRDTHNETGCTGGMGTVGRRSIEERESELRLNRCRKVSGHHDDLCSPCSDL